MCEIQLIEQISGSQKVVEWFGYWPSFHDAEVISVELYRTGTSCLKVHAFRTRDEVNEHGHYVTDRHAIVSFLVEDISALSLHDFNHQNVLSGLSIKKGDDQFELSLGGCFGLQGSIKAALLSVYVTPGLPDSSIYAA
jgi:hypothetical protein